MQVRIDPEQTAEVIERIYEEGRKLYPEKMLEHKSMYDVMVYTNHEKIFEIIASLLVGSGSHT